MSFGAVSTGAQISPGSVGEPTGFLPTSIESEPTLPGVFAGAVDPEQYVVGPGDLFLLNFTGRVTRSLTLAVGPEGTLFIPGAGSVKIDGYTLTRARREVLRRANAEFRGVALDVRLARARTLRLFLTGEVRTPGPLNVSASSRISEVLTDSLLTPRSSRRNILITRTRPTSGDSVHSADPAHVVADLDRFNLTGQAAMNPFVRDGDLVYVPIATRFIEVAGAVARPKVFELGPADSLALLLELAGGPLPSALDDGALLLRWVQPTVAETTSFELADALSGDFNPALRDGDRVFVYYTPRFHEAERATIYGEIVRPGSYPLATNQTRLSDIVRAAGGFLDRADLSTIRVYRASRVAGEVDPEIERLTRLSRSEMTSSEYEILRARLANRREDHRVDWTRLNAEPDLDLLMRDGDVIRVDPILSAVRVEGEVRRPGVVEFRPGRGVSEYVRLAGGLSRRAASSKIRVARAVTGQTILARDLPEVSPGDLIWVPERPDFTLWQGLQTLITVAAQVATVIIAVRR
jgi:protein involved in polysaccharide export with SLBB domain